MTTAVRIDCLIFDLDGTLVQTEKLKAVSYARAAAELCQGDIEEGDVVEAFKEVVGRPRMEVAQSLVARFNLEAKAAERMSAFGVDSPWQAFVRVRLGIYTAMLSDPETIRLNRWPHTIALLEAARIAGCRTALATMSHRPQVNHILQALALESALDMIATREDVEAGKPDPEIYLQVAERLGISPAGCLVIEDSPAGVEAALAAGMRVLAFSTPFTRERLRESGLLSPADIIEDHETLIPEVKRRVGELRI